MVLNSYSNTIYNINVIILTLQNVFAVNCIKNYGFALIYLLRKGTCDLKISKL